jgi:hypothetical protein
MKVKTEFVVVIFKGEFKRIGGFQFRVFLFGPILEVEALAYPLEVSCVSFDEGELDAGYLGFAWVAFQYEFVLPKFRDGYFKR